MNKARCSDWLVPVNSLTLDEYGHVVRVPRTLMDYRSKL